MGGKELVDADSMLMSIICNWVDSVDRSDLTRLTSFLPPTLKTDSLFITIFLKDSVPLKLQYTTFEDGGTPWGIGCFYFNASIPVIHLLKYEEQDIFESFSADGKYLRFSRSIKDGKCMVFRVPAEAKDAFAGRLFKSAYDMTQLYPNFKFNIPQIAYNGDLKLKIFSSLPIYEKPDSNSIEIGILTKGMQVGFLGVFNKRENIRGKGWLWYHVKNDKFDGWIIGHPDYVDELTDENFD